VILLKAAKVDLSSSASLHRFYMLIWKVNYFFHRKFFIFDTLNATLQKLFYLEYLLFPFLS
jgi:hypothetical protein